MDRPDVELVGSQLDDERHQVVEVAGLVAVELAPLLAVTGRGLEAVVPVGDDEGIRVDS